MREIGVTLNDKAFNLIWRALHDREAKLLNIVETAEDEDADDVVMAANDLVYLRMFKEHLEKQGREVFRENTFSLSDEIVDLSKLGEPKRG
jgi:hypothetical protein